MLVRAARAPVAGRQMVLISPLDVHHYSGMVPGFLQGTYREEEIRFDLAGLCRRAGAEFRRGAVTRIDGRARWVEVDGERLSFDQCSLDVGSDAAGADLPGVRAHAFAIRPMSRAVALRDGLQRLASASRGTPVTVAIVGGGLAGVEVALAVHRHLTLAGARPLVTLIEAKATLLPDESPRCRAKVATILGARGVAVRTGAVAGVEPDGVAFDGAPSLPSRMTVWLAGAAPPALLHVSDLPRDDRGFLLVDATLRAVDGAPVWGAGDCIGLAGHPALAKAGVYAVRQAPVLEQNLRAVAQGTSPQSYRPQRSALALVNTADGKALLRWRGLVLHARAAWWLKDAIDRRFVSGYARAAG